MAFHRILLDHKWLVLSVAVLVYWAKKLFIYYRLRHIQGPPGAGFSSFWYQKALLSRNSHEQFAEAVEKHGCLTRIAPNMVITSDHDVWVKVNMPRTRSSRPRWFYEAYTIEPGFHTTLNMSDMDLHHHRRKQMAPGYTTKEIVGLEATIDEGLQNLLDLIRTKYLSTDGRIVPMDLAEKMQFFIGDLMSQVVVGRSLGMMTTDSDYLGLNRTMQPQMRAIQILVSLGLQWLPYVRPVYKMLGPTRHDALGIGGLMGEVYGAVDARVAEAEKTGGPQGSDMLAAFMRHRLSGHELRLEALEQVVAGSDTTSTAIRANMLFVLTNPRVYAKLQAEIDQAVSDGRAPRRPVMIRAEQASGLPYLQAVIREGLRLHPPVPSFLPRDLPPEGETFMVKGESIFIPGGTTIGCSVEAMQRNKALFGEDAEFYRPERWLEQRDPDKLAAMLRANDVIFCSGKYQCPGKPITHVTIPKIIFELTRNFDWAVLKPLKPWSSISCGGLMYIRDMWVQVSERT